MRWIFTSVTVFLVVACLPAAAQVHRCKDSSGQLIYSDRPCDTGQTGGLVERRKSDRAIYEERMQAHAAEERKQRGYAMERQRQADAQSAVQDPNWDQPRQKGYAERLAERNAGVTSNLAPLPHAQRRREDVNNQPAPTAISNCTTGFCTDNQGGVYHRQGKDFMVGADGRTCHRNGAFWNCN